MIKWKEKGWKATGLHHGLITAGLTVIHPVFGGMMVGWYINKEYHENGTGFGLDKCEWLDFMVPLVINLVLLKGMNNEYCSVI